MADFIQEQGSTASFEGNQYVELAGTSQEAKPTGDFLSGSVFVEVDTGKVFLYDRGSSEWHEIAGSGGGGGGGTTVIANPTLAGTEADLTGLQVGDTKYKVGGSSGGGVMLVRVTLNPENHIWYTDKTAGEIKSALEAGTPVYCPYTSVAGSFTGFFNEPVGTDTTRFFYGPNANNVMVYGMNNPMDRDVTLTAVNLTDYLDSTTKSDGK